MVPASVDLVISVEDANGAREFLTRAGQHAPSLTPEAVGATLRERVGIDLLAEPNNLQRARAVFEEDKASLNAKR